MHGANDSMVPFTESTKMANDITNSEVLISYLYEHKEISTDRGPLFKLKELLKMVNFFAGYFRYKRARFPRIIIRATFHDLRRRKE